MSSLKLGSKDNDEQVSVVGIHGNKGMGKTTLAGIVFNCICFEFKGSSFLQLNDFAYPGNLVNLQRKLLIDLKVRPPQVKDLNSNTYEIKKKIHKRKLLLILDNVNCKDQARHFAVEDQGRWFSHGSRIIITTRHKRVLDDLRVDGQYKVKKLGLNDSIRLFSCNAFGSNLPTEGFEELCDKCLVISDGCPSDLAGLGFTLSKKKEEDWPEEIEKWKRNRDRSTFEHNLSIVDRRLILYSHMNGQGAAHPIMAFPLNPIHGIPNINYNFPSFRISLEGPFLVSAFKYSELVKCLNIRTSCTVKHTFSIN